MTTALIDADVITYTVGFAAQKNVYQVRDGEGLLFSSDKRDDCLNFIEEIGEYFPITTVVIPDKLENALHTVKIMLKRIQESCGASKYRPYLTGKHNFRERIATLTKYKGNRDDLTKPFHYDNIREYLVNHHRAILVDGMEADDAIAIVHTRARRERRRTVICSIDKDFDQIEGYHYYFKKDKEEFYEIGSKEAHYNFWKQVLTGDRVDNIVGIQGCGPKKAEKILSSVEPHEYEQAVLSAYRATYGDIHSYHHWRDTDKKLAMNATPEALLIENARLLYLLREPPENGMIKLWKPSWLDKEEWIAPRKTTGNTDQD